MIDDGQSGKVSSIKLEGEKMETDRTGRAFGQCRREGLDHQTRG